MTLVSQQTPVLGARARGNPPHDFRPDIQGLRAVAVGIVVGFHLWPHRLSGGYVGVDVFFVISGYLITAHMYREVVHTGSLRLAHFWARRIRRLLPASFLVLLAGLAGVVAFVPATLWADSARQIGASALYVQNWALVRDSVTYMAQGSAPTVVEHYWSLSVEEQFYVLWPLLMLGVVALAGRRIRPGRRARRRDHHRNTLLVVLGAVAAASLAYSVVATRADRHVAYFSTATRVWEFAAGALLAVAAVRIRQWPALPAGVIAAAGLAAIGTSAFRLTPQSAFPGWISLVPTLGAVLVIGAAHVGPTGRAGRLLAWRPATFVGDLSYSIYLWHWPLIVVVPYVTGVPLRTVDKAAILVATVALSWASKVLVEDGLRRARFLAAAPWRSFAFAGLGMALVVALAAGVDAEVSSRTDSAGARALLDHPRFDGCLGPAALDPANDCPSRQGTGRFVVAPESVTLERRDPLYAGCQTPLASRELKPCTMGATRSPERTVAVVGDSHAAMWLPAFDQLGKDRHWRVRAYTKSSCPLTYAVRGLVGEQTDAEQQDCRAWGEAVVRALVREPSITDVYVTAFSSAYSWEAPDGSRMTDPRTTGFLDAWKRLTDAGKHVFVIRDVPRTAGTEVPTCLATHRRHRIACAVPRSRALPADAIADAARAARGEVGLLDLTDQFCDRRYCYGSVGNAVVYMDTSHLSATYSRALAPYLERQIDGLTRP
jgi:peptidoglycan/LPS O-acetylase OafA/YrhL